MVATQPRERVYTAYGAAADLLFDRREDEIVLSGPAGTGKSRACLEYVHKLLLEHPGARALALRKTLTSLVDSGVVTYREKVLDPGDGVTFFGGSLQEPAAFKYPNGSRLLLGGMDKPTKVMSKEYDLIYVQEATELTLDEWETLTTRLRWAVLPFQQLIGDCNPNAPTHWLKQRADAGLALMLDSRHEDNPTVTPGYMAKLDALTGVRYLRLRKGIWAAAEGMVFDNWDRGLHLIPQRPLPADWPRDLAIDFGYTNPFVAQCWAEDPDGRLYLEWEVYKTQTLVEDHARMIVDRFAGKKPREIICDHDAEGRATFRRVTGWVTMAADKAVTAGIQDVQARMQKAGDGQPRIFIMDDARIHPADPFLVENHKPTCTAEEIESYVWDDAKVKEQPLKQDDHGCLVAGTLVETDDGPVPVELVRRTMQVATRRGYRRVIAAGQTGITERLYTVRLADGRSLTGTGNHPVWVDRYDHDEWVRLDALRYGDILMVCEASPSPTTASSFDGIPTQEIGPIARTSFQVDSIESGALAGSMRKSGRRIMGRFQRTATSIITMVTASITSLTTSSVSRKPTTSRGIKHTQNRKTRMPSRTSNPSGHWRLNGIGAMQGEHGIVITHGGFTRNESQLIGSVISAVRHLPQSAAVQTIGSAPTTVRVHGDEHQDWMMLSGPVCGADNASPSTNTAVPRVALCHVAGVSVTDERAPVYNLAVDGDPEYFANGILVHNCDAMRYECKRRSRRSRPMVAFDAQGRAL